MALESILLVTLIWPPLIHPKPHTSTEDPCDKHPKLGTEEGRGGHTHRPSEPEPGMGPGMEQLLETSH